MRIVDANVLLYAVDLGAPNHRAAKGWLDAALSSNETVLFPWVSLLAFVRLATHPRVFEKPVTVDDAFDVVDAWISQPNAQVPTPDRAHARRMRAFLLAVGPGGNLVNDAHLAALAVQQGAVVMTFDRDFSRFEGVRWEAPG